MFNTSDGRQYRAFDLAPAGDHLEGYAVVFNQKTVLDKDPYTGAEFYETIDRKAFDDCDMGDVVLNVDHAGPPIARTRAGNLKLSVDDFGLKVTAHLTTSRGKEIWEEVSAGNLDKMSFAFNIGQQHYNESTHTRSILKISKLFDVSVVTHPAYEQTCVFARASMAGHIADEQRALVEQKVNAMRSLNLTPAPELRRSPQWAGMEYDIEKHTALIKRAQDFLSWTPGGKPEDIAIAEEKYRAVATVIEEINQLAEEEQRKIRSVENGEVQFYGWNPMQILPNTKEQVDALLKRGISKNFGMLKKSSPELYEYYLGQTSERNINMMNENIELRALQSYICKGISHMDEDERRALTTTGTGAAIIPSEIADKIIFDAGYSILTHRAHRFADGRHGKLSIPIIPAIGGVGWHKELELVDPYEQSISSVSIEGMELMKVISASTAMSVMAVEEFGEYMVNLLSAEMLDALESSYIKGKKGENGPADGLDNLDLTGRTISATNAITIENIAAAVAKLPSKVQHGAIVMGNAATLASLLTAQGTYAFDMRTTLKDMGIELVQNPYVSDGEIYVVGQPSEALFLNFWQPISVNVNPHALYMRAGIAMRALSVVGFAWVPDYIAKVSVSA